MGEVDKAGTKRDVLAQLVALNPRTRPDDLAIYADAFQDYQEASENIDKNGNIVAHPRTGTPIENPYIRVRAAAVAIIRKIKIKTGSLWSGNGAGISGGSGGT